MALAGQDIIKDVIYRLLKLLNSNIDSFENNVNQLLGKMNKENGIYCLTG